MTNEDSVIEEAMDNLREAAQRISPPIVEPARSSERGCTTTTPSGTGGFLPSLSLAGLNPHVG